MSVQSALLAFIVVLPGLAAGEAGEAGDEIVVTASRAEKPRNTIPNTVTVIDETDLEQQLSVSGNDLSTVLGNLVPSFAPSRQKMTGYGESLRGRDPLYLVDGVPQSNPLRDGSRDGYTIDPLMLQRVEVIHGANAIHGLGASGGIINLITRRPAASWQQSLRVDSAFQGEDLGESAGYGLNYSASGRVGAFDVIGSIGYRSTGIGYDADGRVIGFDNTQGDTMDADMLNVFVKGGYGWGEQRLELTVNDFELAGNNDWVAVDGDIAVGVPTTAEPGVVPGKAPTNDVTMVSVNYTNEAVFGQALRLQVFDQDFAATYGGGTFGTFQDPAFGTEVFDQSQNESHKTGAKLTLAAERIGKLPLSLVYGADLLRDETQQLLVQTGRAWVPASRYRNTSLFAQAEFTGVERLTVVTGVRHERARLEVDDFTTLFAYNGGQSVAGGKPRFSETLYNLGATLQATDGLRVFANVSEGFAMPDVGRVLRGIDVPGQDVETFLNLTPIVTDNGEIGIEHTGTVTRVQLSYYTSDSDFGQRLVANSDGIYAVQRERIEIDGIELRARWQATGNDALDLRYAHTDGRFDADADGSVDADLSGANATPDRVNLSWERSWTDRLNTRLQVSYLADRDFRDAAGVTTSSFDGYTTVDLGADMAIGNGVLLAGVQNLTNEDYYTYYSQTLGNDSRNFKGFGRSFRLAYRMEF
ncbi:MAG TPA: TonB-dependent receptor [Woeseiaceae bacterium]|nr:TonB-dependent receptor [Woeseiaceae bacterium]